MTKKDKILITEYECELGELLIGEYNGKLCLCDWKYRKMRNQIDTRIQKGLAAEYEYGKGEISELTIFQLDEYINKKRKNFAIPIILTGTEFQKRVWQYLTEIPYGKTETYLGLSKKMKSELAIRAVASANGANAISIIIPCHRVIGSGGALVGYAGGLAAKNKLLKIEGIGGNQLTLFE